MQKEAARRTGQLPLLQNRLILNRFFCGLFGSSDFNGFRELLRNTKKGIDEDGHSHFYHVLETLGALQIPTDRLAEYDLRITEYIEKLNRMRSEPIQLLYFQYLAVLFTEIYLDRFFTDRDGFLAELNAFVESENHKLSPTAPPYSGFAGADLSKIAIWMATGSGKTLITHMNLWQYLYHSKGKVRHRNVLLITPNEGLSRQHLQELAKSGIPARHYGGAGGTLFSYGSSPVTVIEITKLTATKRGGGVRVEVDAFGPDNLLLVDEGHRGATGEQWRNLRDKLAEQGFTFEYSATFGQIVNGAAKSKRPQLLEVYSKAIVFDYSYPHFYHDGYGKDYWILNLKEKTNAFNDWMLLGNLISFTEQRRLYDYDRKDFRPYNIDTPLWVFVGHSVTGGKSKDDRSSLTDVEHIVTFLDDFLRNTNRWISRISRVLNGQTGLRNPDGEDIFQELFPYIRKSQLTPRDVYEDVVKRVFHGKLGQRLRAVELRAAPGEIGVRVGADNPYFGVINIGDVRGLLKLLKVNDIPCEDENITDSLFDTINDIHSTVNVLIGSRKFMEGWDSFRVSSMGLMNVGKGEGSQIIQLFGRGVRLRGKDFSLKRSTVLEPGEAPASIRLLETLNIFGVRANYMAQFREYLQQEGIETDYEEVLVPIQVQDIFLRQGLQVPRLPESDGFQHRCGLVLRLDKSIKVRLDLRPRLEAAMSGDELTTTIEKTVGENWAQVIKENISLLNWDRVYLDLLGYKHTKAYYNLSFTPDRLRGILAEGRYDILAPPGRLALERYADLEQLEKTAIALLRKYVTAFYSRNRREWEQSNMRLASLKSDDSNLAFGGYRIKTKRTFAHEVRKLLRQSDGIYRKDMENFPNIHFDRHLYQPLLSSDPRLKSVSPQALNEGERKLVDDLRNYVLEHATQFASKDLYLLRNLTRSKGIGFFNPGEGAAFYPDFILWTIEGGCQWIAFIDPHGLLFAGGLGQYKIQLHRYLNEITPQLQNSCPEWTVSLTSFIISPASYQESTKIPWVREHTKERFEQENVLFQDEDGRYVEKLVSRMLI